MYKLKNKTFILFFTLLFAVILCGAVSATSSVTLGNILSVVSTHSVTQKVSSKSIYPKLIDYGVTHTKTVHEIFN